MRHRIRELRLARGLKQEELCERAGVSADAITRIESGSRVPTLDTLERLASALGVPPAAFFEGAPSPRERVASAPTQRVVTMLEEQPDSVLALAENVVTAVVRAYGEGTVKPRTSSTPSAPKKSAAPRSAAARRGAKRPLTPRS